MTSPVIFLEKLWKSTINQHLTPFVWSLLSQIRPNSRKKTNSIENVDQPLVNPQIEKVLSVTDILKEMSDRQSLLTEDLRKKKINTNLLHNIQTELQKEGNKSISMGSTSQEEEIIKLTIDTTRKLGLHNNTFKEKDLQFMLQIGWKLDQYNLGIPQKLEADDQYPTMKANLVKQAASISSEKIYDAITAYLSFSFGMNSGYLFYSYWSANSKMNMPWANKLSPSKIKYAKDTGLKSLLS
jgi:hypothetical protein